MNRPLRRDAQRNRAALVDAARQVLAERGVDAPLEAVAKRAGVAIGTLYRHFPERGDLIDAILDEKVAAWTELARQAMVLDDAWAGLVCFLERTCELQARDRAFTELVCLSHQTDRSEINRLIVRLVERAQGAGTLRRDVGPVDLAFFVMANSRVAEAAPGQWRRHFTLMLDALRAAPAQPR
ncbi:TetR/AcrR family transcriptional regulator [Nonomuraea sp. K274]|uniref:TetR/AcrR family transcriptional regulator n=1 Tax=Nonomuraea cypriaca TaxID=1187855 RepID=A0A931F3X2_9ACTN|nr:TetR/AcrR family transcriptional regulator [Nonomuraea cypriaca]MBF8193070.1 TetR/AcrR family transcriptional regulator [Nonomuraea cypriaca]